MRRLKAILRAVDTISEWTGKVFAFLIAIMMVVVTYEVVARYFFNSPTTWSLEVTQFLLAGCGAMGGAYVLLKQRHIKVDILYSRLGIRGRAVLDVVTASLFFLFICFFFINSLEMAVESTAYRETTASYFAPPLYPIKIAITAGVFLVLLQGLAKFVRDFAVAVRGEGAARELAGIPEKKRP
ncbi:MAG: TRAP transporter small permease subunit [Chloroflexota bacterium]